MLVVLARAVSLEEGPAPGPQGTVETRSLLRMAERMSWADFRDAHGYTDDDEPAAFAQYVLYVSDGKRSGWNAAGEAEPSHGGSIRHLTHLARQFWRWLRQEQPDG